MSIEDFMNEMSKSSVSDFDDEYITIERQYKNMFGHIVPREMLPPSISENDIKDAMRVSISEGKDRVLELLKVELNLEYLY